VEAGVAAEEEADLRLHLILVLQMYQMIGGITTCTTTSSQVEEKVSEMIQGSKGGSTSRYRCIFTCF